MHHIDIKLLDNRLREMPPQYATPGAAGLDLRACIEAPVHVKPGDTTLIPSGIAIHLADPGLAAIEAETKTTNPKKEKQKQTIRKLNTKS